MSARHQRNQRNMREEKAILLNHVSGILDVRSFSEEKRNEVMYQLLSNVLIHKLYISRKLLHRSLHEGTKTFVIFRVMISLDSQGFTRVSLVVVFAYFTFLNHRILLTTSERERGRDVSLSHNICSFSPNLCKQQFPWWFRLALFSGSFEYEMCLPEFTVTQSNFRIRRKFSLFPHESLLSEIRGLTSPADTPAQIANWIGIWSTKLLILNISITFAGGTRGARVKGNPSAILCREIAF